jgi:ATP-dependent DNA ligase
MPRSGPKKGHVIPPGIHKLRRQKAGIPDLAGMTAGGKLPAFRAPQLATLVDHVPTGSDWMHEVKYDGYRTLLAVGGGKAKAYTRTGLDWSDRFAPIVAAATARSPGPR